MINILCFGDSNTFGTNPKGGRHSWNTRWPGRLQVLLGPEYYVIEEGMGGRTTVWDDPLEPGRCGIQALPMALQSHKPLDLVILFLGTNDCKAHFHASPRVITKGMENLCHTVQGEMTWNTVPMSVLMKPHPVNQWPLRPFIRSWQKLRAVFSWMPHPWPVPAALTSSTWTQRTMGHWLRESLRW